jgi:hypothetical protein
MNDWRRVLRAGRAIAGPRHSSRSAQPSPPVEDFVIPKTLYANTRDNIEEICRQINAAYAYDICDGSAVLIRKLVEMLLILSYKHHSIERTIKDGTGNYLELSAIVKEACQNSKLDFSRNAREYLELFREKGNLSAHNPFHISTRRDIETLQPKVRHLFQELLFKSGIRK